MKVLKVIVEKHASGYTAYPLGMNGVVVGQGTSFEGAIEDVTSAIRFRMRTFGNDTLGQDNQVLEAFVAEVRV